MGELSWEEYEALLAPIQKELIEMARWVAETGQRVVVLFEGRDTAGKGGAIDAITRTLNPRQCHVVALGTPSERERGQWYFQRYVPYLPATGEIVLYDRSWYNRAGVERVMGYCTEEEVFRFLREAPLFEQLLVEDGIFLIKYWLTCDQQRQEERLAKRLNNPLKRWKLSPIDIEARNRYADYTEAREEMLRATHTSHAPWTLIDFNDQKLGRLTLLRDLLDKLPDTHLPQREIDWPPLGHAPDKEEYDVLSPIAPYRAPAA